MKMVEDESEVFEITDFTTASEWERFIARIEEIIHEWKLTSVTAGPPLNKGDLTNGTWDEIPATVKFADFNFTMTRHLLRLPVATMPRDSSMSDVGQSAERSENRAKAPAPNDDDDESTNPVIWHDMMSADNSFPSRAHCLCRWYGLRDFIVLTTSAGTDDITSESRVNTLLSSLSIAANNTGCQVPMFVQAHSKWRRLFFGTSEFPGFRTSFEMVQLKNTPSHLAYLSGLLDVFKGKIASPVSPFPAVSVAVRFTFVIQDWSNHSWPQLPPDFDSATGEVGITEFGNLPFGACEDSVSDLHLSTTWPTLSEDMISESEVYSDLDPLQAPHWSVRVRMTENPQCLLGDYLNEFVKFCSRQETTQQLLGRSITDQMSEQSDVDAAQALQRLTDPHKLPSLSKAVKRATSKLAIKPEEAPIPTDLLNEILLFLFPDAKTDPEIVANRKDSSTKQEVEQDSEATMTDSASSKFNEDGQFKELFKQLKSAPLGSLTSRLAVCMCVINHSHGGLRAVAHLWQEFVLEMRYRWENNYMIPDLESGSPNMGCCLLHQKLQMLNCCIERKKTRESTSVDQTTKIGDRLTTSTNKDISISSEDEEFFECREEDSEKQDENVQTCNEGTTDENITLSENDSNVAGAESPPADELDSDNKNLDKPNELDSCQLEADGRLKPFEDLKLLNVDDLMYIPVTQEPSPMTEDLLEEHAEVLAKLGTSAEGAHLRARMQSACLLSDMEAFKAANPGCILGDFVRWYSPRDWIEERVVDEDGNVSCIGQLSQRMQIPGNMWLEVWQSAQPVPARRQRRLFDDTKEAEKVLHWLASMKPSDVAVRLLPMLIHAAITKLMEHDECQLPFLKKLMTQITGKLAKATRSAGNEARRFEDLVRHVNFAEVGVTRAQSLLTKLNQVKGSLEIRNEDLHKFVSDLLEMPEVNIVGASRAPIGILIYRLFVNALKAEIVASGNEEDSASSTDYRRRDKTNEFPKPVGKEYILRSFINRPAPWSRPAPQRMYCVLMSDDFRLAGAFTSDTTFK